MLIKVGNQGLFFLIALSLFSLLVKTIWVHPDTLILLFWCPRFCSWSNLHLVYFKGFFYLVIPFWCIREYEPLTILFKAIETNYILLFIFTRPLLSLWCCRQFMA